MKISLKGKSLIKKIALALAGVAAITAVGFGVKAIIDYTKNDLKKITPTFEVGNLGSDGKFVDDESTLYTKEAFGCYGLQVKPDFDSTVNYQIFYYDILDNYISSTSFMSDGYSGEAPVNGAYARLVIEPKDDEDGKISWTERIKYPSQLEVKVRKEQKINERYGVYKGKVLQVVTDTSELVFQAGIRLNYLTSDWQDNNSWATTAVTVLKVERNSTLNMDFTGLGETVKSKLYCHVFQFVDLPLDSNFIAFNSSTDIVNAAFKLNSKTQYVILCVDYTSATDFSWNASSLAKLPSCFSVTKTK